ncbi:NAD(P)-dependent oxidoreductase [Rhodovarius sp.]|uniref:NAD-dependent epimerase/dehydratase family protein n=1 Tax=Rhodovarius sp. TaxID=2972673 RepID=UPI00333F88EE
MSLHRPVLLTGASGRLGHGLAARLAAAGVVLRLTDRHAFPGALPPGASFTQQDLGDAAAIAELALGCGTILHFGGVPNEGPGFESILDANLRGCFHVYEAARAAGARVVFASSNHAFGFHPRPGEAAARLEADCAYRPDTFYGLSKVYGEQMGRLYWDKHAVESVQLRIGSCTATPQDARALATWFSHEDLARFCLAAIAAPRTGWAVIWGASANPASFWGGDDRALLGWEPQDSAEAWRAEIEGRVSADPLVERFQGGAFCALDWPPGRGRG